MLNSPQSGDGPIPFILSASCDLQHSFLPRTDPLSPYPARHLLRLHYARRQRHEDHHLCTVGTLRACRHRGSRERLQSMERRCGPTLPSLTAALCPQARSPAGLTINSLGELAMRTPITAHVFGLLPPPPIPQVCTADTRLPEVLARVVRALEERLNEAKMIDTSATTADNSTQTVASFLATRDGRQSSASQEPGP